MKVKNSKKLSLIIGVFLMVIGIIAYSINTQLKKNDEELYQAKIAYPEIYDSINSLSFHSFETEVKDGELLVYIGRPDCGDCNEFEPAFLSMVEERNLEQEISYLNVSKLRKDEGKWEDFKETYGVMYTPTIAYFKDGQLVSKVEWTPEKGSVLSEFEAWLDAYTYS
ncbi:thioredoxin family protein [Enterococcus sp. BWB1-3]|uniref:thioredoxin family protein n=1 Tax=unclassified Enterococcus TaxID=2608891 RepID=UPI001921E137|nr:MULTISPECIES: thioredoxin family protein [unclassified Enterococcus]MBL1227830.1 thioredoxin family protein [Enterococcus sp. BWB1-3]MCB5953379.1 thioredoxin family protein [Enterococcus sp. BWT-B8]